MLNRKIVPITVFAVTLVLMMAVTALSTQAALAQGSSAGGDQGVIRDVPIQNRGTDTAFGDGGEGGATSQFEVVPAQDNAEPIDRSVPPEAVIAKPPKPPLFPE